MNPDRKTVPGTAGICMLYANQPAGRYARWFSIISSKSRCPSRGETPSPTGTLEDCEARYRELDIRHQLLRRIGIEEDRMDEKMELCKAINRFLKEHKDEYLRRCRQCGRRLPATHPFGVCDRCFRKFG